MQIKKIPNPNIQIPNPKIQIPNCSSGAGYATVSLKQCKEYVIIWN
jgi:hypothetical protein